jgi:orotidine-5'-phosphate decarboxylase
MSGLSSREATNQTQLCVALDFASTQEADVCLERLSGLPILAKVGLELFIAAGPIWVGGLNRRFGVEVFLDLKLHDIPNTVQKSVARIAEIPGVSWTTIHTGGGAEMLQAARKAAPNGRGLKLLGVTVLTSFSHESWRRIGERIGAGGRSADESVHALAALAADCELDGVVCSPLEISHVREHHPRLFTVVPGIRPAGADSGDQARTLTPGEASARGATAIVVGRPITQAQDPRRAAEMILKELR